MNHDTLPVRQGCQMKLVIGTNTCPVVDFVNVSGAMSTRRAFP